MLVSRQASQSALSSLGALAVQTGLQAVLLARLFLLAAVRQPACSICSAQPPPSEPKGLPLLTPLLPVGTFGDLERGHMLKSALSRLRCSPLHQFCRWQCKLSPHSCRHVLNLPHCCPLAPRWAQLDPSHASDSRPHVVLTRTRRGQMLRYVLLTSTHTAGRGSGVLARMRHVRALTATSETPTNPDCHLMQIYQHTQARANVTLCWHQHTQRLEEVR